MAPFTSQCVRRAVEAAAKDLPAQQKEALLNYMAPSSGFVNPQDVVDAALLLESLARYVSSTNQDITHHKLFALQIIKFSFIFSPVL